TDAAWKRHCCGSGVGWHNPWGYGCGKGYGYGCSPYYGYGWGPFYGYGCGYGSRYGCGYGSGSSYCSYRPVCYRRHYSSCC
uniref:Uncharacterized protein n=1 Tax=Sus scrofa TaxID=9823 RepID=A0A8W4F8E5_PIG